ncbi:MAG: hypothetical protein CTY39_08615, partial [Hyphomicrobium sp.]
MFGYKNLHLESPQNNVQGVGNMTGKIKLQLTTAEHGFEDFDVTGHQDIRRVCVPRGIEQGDIFNVHGPESEKRGAVWCGSIEKSLARFLGVNADSIEVSRDASKHIEQPVDSPGKVGSKVLLTLHTACGCVGQGLLGTGMPLAWDSEPDGETLRAVFSRCDAATMGVVEVVQMDGEDWREFEESHAEAALVANVANGHTIVEALDCVPASLADRDSVSLEQSHAAPEPLLYRAQVSVVGDLDVSPSVAVFQVDEQLARDIIKFASLVKANDVYKIERFDYRAEFLRYDPETESEEAEEAGGDNAVRTECDCLVVTDNEFFFNAYVKHTDVSVECKRQSIAELAQHFGLRFGESLSPKDLSDRLEQALPEGGGYEKGYKDALQSVALALAPKIAESILDEAITTALDAYANNADQEQSRVPRVLVVVSGGVAEDVSDAGVEVEVFD